MASYSPNPVLQDIVLTLELMKHLVENRDMFKAVEKVVQDVNQLTEDSEILNAQAMMLFEKDYFTNGIHAPEGNFSSLQDALARMNNTVKTLSVTWNKKSKEITSTLFDYRDAINEGWSNLPDIFFDRSNFEKLYNIGEIATHTPKELADADLSVLMPVVRKREEMAEMILLLRAYNSRLNVFKDGKVDRALDHAIKLIRINKSLVDQAREMDKAIS